MIIRSFLNRWAVVLGLVLVAGFCYAQPQSHTLENVDFLQKKEKRPIVIFFHTDWCRYCKMMEKTTFRNREIEEMLNQNFYYINFDAETKDDVCFNGQKYTYMPTGYRVGVHALAEKIGTIDGELNFPTLVVLNVNYEVVFQYSGYLSANDLMVVLNKVQKMQII